MKDDQEFLFSKVLKSAQQQTPVLVEQQTEQLEDDLAEDDLAELINLAENFEEDEEEDDEEDDEEVGNLMTTEQVVGMVI